MEDCWSYVRVISAALGLDREPVGVTYTDEEPAVEVEPGAYTVCGAIQKAASGGVVRLSEEFCACSGGKAHIGLTARGEIPWKLLVEGEKWDLTDEQTLAQLQYANDNFSEWRCDDGEVGYGVFEYGIYSSERYGFPLAMPGGI